MRIGLYARVSTDDQHVEAQLGPLRAYAARLGADAREFADAGVSGRKARRPGLDALMAAARRREIGVVAVTALDRLARSLPHFAQIGAELESLGCQLVSLREAIDTATPMGRAMFAMSGVFAQLEVDLIVERTRLGLDAARRRGKRLGRPPADYGRQLVDRAKRLQASGHSVRQIADVLGTSRGRAHRILRSR